MLSEGKERQETTKTPWKNLTGRSFTLFIEAQRSDATKRNYAYSILKFMEYLNIGSYNVDSLLKDQDYTKKIQDQIIDHILYLKAKFLRYSTIAGYIAAVLSFYELNDITLNTKRICRYLGEAPLPLENRPYSKKEIAKILEFCDERSRAIILLLASGGCRINAVPFLKLKDLTVLPKYNLYEVMIYSDSNQKYYSFTTPEAAKAINQYLGYRERSGEKLTPQSPLFREQFDREDSFAVHNPKPLGLRGMENSICYILIKSGIKKVKHQTEFSKERGRVRSEIKMTSGFRKFFDTQLEAAGLRPLVKEKLMGHSIGLDKHYLKPMEQDVLTEYLKAVDNLTINEENRLKIKVEELTAKTETNEYIINHRLKEKEVEVQNLKHQLNSLPKQIEEENMRTIQKMLANFKEELRASNNNPTAAS
jgi:integrase